VTDGSWWQSWSSTSPDLDGLIDAVFEFTAFISS
jgi:hypothetical protein